MGKKATSRAMKKPEKKNRKWPMSRKSRKAINKEKTRPKNPLKRAAMTMKMKKVKTRKCKNRAKTTILLKRQILSRRCRRWTSRRKPTPSRPPKRPSKDRRTKSPKSKWRKCPKRTAARTKRPPTTKRKASAWPNRDSLRVTTARNSPKSTGRRSRRKKTKLAAKENRKNPVSRIPIELWRKIGKKGYYRFTRLSRKPARKMRVPITTTRRPTSAKTVSSNT